VRQAQLIKQKTTQIKELSDQVQAAQLKVANYDRTMQRNQDLTKQVLEMSLKIKFAE